MKTRYIKVDRDALKEVLTAMLSHGPSVAELRVVHNLHGKLGKHPNDLSTLIENWDNPDNHFDEEDASGEEDELIAAAEKRIEQLDEYTNSRESVLLRYWIDQLESAKGDRVELARFLQEVPVGAYDANRKLYKRKREK